MPRVAASRPLGGSGDGVGVEHVLPDYRQSPLGHDVGEDENGTEVFAPGQIGAGDQKGEQATEYNGYHAGPHCQPDRVEQGGPQVDHGLIAGEQVDVVDHRIPRSLSGEVGVDGAGVDFKGVLHNGDDGGHRAEGEHDAHQQQDHVVGFGEKGFDFIPTHGGPIGPGNGDLIHNRLLSAGMESALGCGGCHARPRAP